MAKYRHIYTSFWEAPVVSETFTPEDKLFFLYLLTNSHTTQIGVYKIQKKLIAFELGYSIESVESLMCRFEEHHKIIKYNAKTRELAIRNWGKFNLNKGGKPIEDCLRSELPMVEDKSLLTYVLDGIKSIRIREIFLQEISKTSQILNSSKNNDTYHDTDDDSCNDTPPISVQNENENENKNKNKKEYIYTQTKTTSNQEEHVDNVDNMKKSVEEPVEKVSLTKPEKFTNEDIIKLYNTICKSLPEATTLTSKRKNILKARIKTFKDIKVFRELFTKAEASNFLSGRNGKWTACNFDWLLNEENMVKVLEGTYKNDDTHKKTNFNNYDQRSYDYDALETKMLDKSSQESARASANITLDDKYNALQNKILGRNV